MTQKSMILRKLPECDVFCRGTCDNGATHHNAMASFSKETPYSPHTQVPGMPHRIPGDRPIFMSWQSGWSGKSVASEMNF
jgi:hypothetical protein